MYQIGLDGEAEEGTVVVDEGGGGSSLEGWRKQMKEKETGYRA